MRLMQLHFIALISPARYAKPETVVYAEQYGIREMQSHETLHLHDEGSTRCKVCGRQGFMLWTDSMDKFMSNASRCGDISTVEVELT